jgi:uncharacterized protein YkwD
VNRVLLRYGGSFAVVAMITIGAAAIREAYRPPSTVVADGHVLGAGIRHSTAMEGASTAEPGLPTTTTAPPPPPAPPAPDPPPPPAAAPAPHRSSPAPAPKPAPPPAPAPAPPPPPPVGDAGGAAHLQSLLNSYRTSHGVAALAAAADARSKAQAHAEDMAGQQRLYHDNLASGLNDDWYTVGENVGEGGSIDSINQAFINSSEHRSNMVDPSFNYVGVGVAQDANGRYWVCEVFVGR